MQLTRRAAALTRRVLNPLIYRLAGGQERPVFLDVGETAPELLTIDENYEVIAAELERVLSVRQQIPRFHEVDEAQNTISDADGRAWRVLFVHLHRAGSQLPNRELFPRTAEIIDGIPNVTQAYFSILEPKKSVPAHCGPYLGFLRYHTAFRVPKERPPTLRVKDRFYTWQERKSILFDDSWEHEVINDSDEVRVVLAVDILRPLPWPAHVLNLLAREIFLCKSLTRPALRRIKHIDLGQSDLPGESKGRTPRSLRGRQRLPPRRQER